MSLARKPRWPHHRDAIRRPDSESVRSRLQNIPRDGKITPKNFLWAESPEWAELRAGRAALRVHLGRGRAVRHRRWSLQVGWRLVQNEGVVVSRVCGVPALIVAWLDRRTTARRYRFERFCLAVHPSQMARSLEERQPRLQQNVERFNRSELSDAPPPWRVGASAARDERGRYCTSALSAGVFAQMMKSNVSALTCSMPSSCGTSAEDLYRLDVRAHR